MSNWLLRIATLYFVIGVCMGMYMGATHDHSQASVHAHINLLGWVSLGLIGLLYSVRPAFAETRLARAHFVLHNLGLPIQAIALSFALRGNEQAAAIIPLGSMLIGAGVACLLVNVWLMTRKTTVFSRWTPATAAG